MMDERISTMTTLELRRAAPFSTLFPIKENVLKKITEDMKTNGYDCAHPITVWAGNRCKVIDGNTRLEAALKAGMSTIPVVLKEFKTEDKALQYAIKSQSNRRNLTDSELLNCLAELDKRKDKNANLKQNRTEAQNCASGKTATETADLLGVSTRKVEQVRTVNEHAPAHIKNAVAAGKMSVNKAYNQTMENRRREAEDEISESPELVRNKRKEAIVKSIGGMLHTRLEREIQEYPEIRYSQSEIEVIGDQVHSLVTESIKLLPIETDIHNNQPKEDTNESA
ncbi:MAG: ParB N-terminal domain-containing protein [Victivallales bacterium]